MRIAFVTDIHLNATPAGWQQQPRWCDGISQVLSALEQKLQQEEVDLVIFGGDLVDKGTPEQVEQAAKTLAKIPVPAVVCLGNHDLTEATSLATWRTAMRLWPQAQLADVHLDFPKFDVYALNNAWRSDGGEPAFFWDGKMPYPDLMPSQLEQLDRWLSADADRPAILALHAPLYPIPPELSGASAPAEVQPEAYTRPLLELIGRHPRLRLIMAGHTHCTCATRHDGTRVHLTATSLTEVPYQFPIIDVGQAALQVSTAALSPVATGPVLNPAKQWVIGRESDRNVTIANR